VKVVPYGPVVSVAVRAGLILVSIGREPTRLNELRLYVFHIPNIGCQYSSPPEQKLYKDSGDM